MQQFGAVVDALSKLVQVVPFQIGQDIVGREEAVGRGRLCLTVHELCCLLLIWGRGGG